MVNVLFLGSVFVEKKGCIQELPRKFCKKPQFFLLKIFKKLSFIQKYVLEEELYLKMHLFVALELFFSEFADFDQQKVIKRDQKVLQTE